MHQTNAEHSVDTEQGSVAVERRRVEALLVAPGIGDDELLTVML